MKALETQRAFGKCGFPSLRIEIWICFVFTAVGTFPQMSPSRRGAWAQTHKPPALASVHCLVSLLERERSVQPQTLSAESAWLPAAAGLRSGHGAARAGSGGWLVAAVWPPRFLASCILHIARCLICLGAAAPRRRRPSKDAEGL